MPPQGTLAQKRAANKVIAKNPPREASQKFVLRVDRFVEIFADEGLERFQNLEKLDGLGLLQGARTGKFPDPLPPLPV
eukprot:7666700-Pyramimonas_sp.AAC.1